MARFARELPRDLREDFVGDDEARSETRTSKISSRTTPVPAPVSSWRTRPRTRFPRSGGSRSRTASSSSPRTTWPRLPASSARTLSTSRQSGSCSTGRPRLGHGRPRRASRRSWPRARERFDEANLRRAHQVQYHKALVDIISMVKHAASEESPLLTAQERVERAIAHTARGKGVQPRAAALAGPYPGPPG